MLRARAAVTLLAVATTWDRLSRRYDRQAWLERAAIAAALDLLRPAPSERLLDVGTGTGAVLRELGRRAVRPEAATGVDASAAMLARVPPLPAGWTTATADARALPFADGAFDVACAAYVLHVLPDADRPAALGELRRVLAPGGRLITITPAVPDSGWARPLARSLDRLGARRPERLCGLRALDPRADLARAGLAVASARWSLRGYPSLCVLARRP